MTVVPLVVDSHVIVCQGGISFLDQSLIIEK